MKARFTLIAILFQAINILQAQTDWHINGNAGTNSGTNFIGTKDTAAFKIRTNNKVRMTINSSGNVGIGTANPLDKFHVNGTGILARFGTGTTSANFNYSIIDNTLGCYIEQRGNTTTTGSDYLVLQSSKQGLKADYSQFYIDPHRGFLFLTLGAGNGNVGIGTSSPANKLSVAGNADFTGNVGIGTSSPTYKLSVTAAPLTGLPVAMIENTKGVLASDGLHIKAGSNTIEGTTFIRFLRPDETLIGYIQQFPSTGVVYSTTSDRRLKNVIGATQKGLSDLMKIKIYDYTFKSDAQKKVLTGFMAQELYDIFPQSVSKPIDFNEPAEKNPWMVDYGSVTPLIIKSVQEQQQIIDELKRQNENLQKQINELKALLISQNKENIIETKQIAVNK